MKNSLVAARISRLTIVALAAGLLGLACTPTSTGIPTGSGGTGVNPCSSAQALCGDQCIEVLTDPANCGACGLPCAAGQICQAGSCACEAGRLLCNGSCVLSDASHCGTCTTVCATNQTCSNGACVDDGGTGGGSGGGGTIGGGAGTTGSGGGAGSGGSVGSTGGAGTGGSTTGRGGAGGGSAAGRGGTGGAAGASGGGAGTGGGATGSGGAASTQPALVTSAQNAYWQTNAQPTTVTTGTASVTVNDATTAQSWEGFGGSFNEKGWSFLMMLSQADRDRALRLLFGSDGARFNLGRIPMGASDYALNRYTLDEVASGADYTMAQFSISRDMQNLIPYIKAAQAVNGSIRFWASPWTPPTWMKNGPFMGSGGAFDAGVMKSDAQTLAAHALYFVKFVQAYAQQAIPIEAVAPQNEPNYSLPYPSCHWDSPVFATFVGQHLGPAIKNAGLTTKIMLGTMSNNGASADRSVVSAVMADATAKSYIKLLGYQWGMRSYVGDAKQYNLPIWQTEHQCGNYNKAPMAPNDHAYAVESWGLLRDWIKAGVTAYSVWNMVLDTVGNSIDSVQPWPQNALLTVNTSSRTLILTPTYHVFRHFSQFVAPGAQVVATTGGDALAFKNRDGSIVTVMYNAGGATTYTVAVGGKRLQFAMPGNGWATLYTTP